MAWADKKQSGGNGGSGGGEGKKKNIGALWERTGPKGDYLAGEIDGKRVVIFKNGFKKSDKHPDWVIYPAYDRQERESSPDQADQDPPF